MQIPQGSELARQEQAETTRQQQDRLQSKLYYRYKMKLERQRAKQNKEVEDFLKQELERLLAPIREEE